MARLLAPTLVAVVAVALALVASALHTLPSSFSLPGPLSFLGESLSSVLTRLNLSSSDPSTFVCKPHTYATEIVSVDPLIIYIHDFLTPNEVTTLLEAGESLFAPSLITNNQGAVRSSARRTSHSARLPVEEPVVNCVLDRAERFMGAMMTLPHDDFQPPQLVRYTVGQRFDVHADWFATPQQRRADSTGIGSTWNRPASFLAVLEDDCTAGETWFPHVDVPGRAAAAAALDPESAESRVWRRHEEGGLAFKPVRGNALFWVNLFSNGTGDDRTRHAGLPVDSGIKTAMNIWPRVYGS